MHKRAWMANSPHGSRISTQRKGTAGNPVLCQIAAAETTFTVRFSLPYQSALPCSASTRWSDLRQLSKGSASVLPSGEALLSLSGASQRGRFVEGGIQP